MKDSRAEGDADGGASQAPQVARSLGGQLGAFQSHLIKNPDVKTWVHLFCGRVMEQMLNTQVMQTVLQNGDMLSSLVSMNRQMRELMDDNPELRRMLMDPSIMKASAEAFQDPLAVRELISNTETAVANINATVPGGYDSLRRLYEECSRGGKECEDDRGGGEPAVAPQIREARDAAEDAEKLAEMSMPPVWAEAFDPSAMAAMMQDPNMHQLMSSVFRSAENAHKLGARSSEK
ncbi:E1 ubiquitin-activating protein uba2, partial [Perkinsus olseni]